MENNESNNSNSLDSYFLNDCDLGLYNLFRECYQKFLYSINELSKDSDERFYCKEMLQIDEFQIKKGEPEPQKKQETKEKED